jgi:CheY-like chemotaxis protein
MHNRQVSILLADDDAEDWELLHEALRAIDPDIQVIMARNGEEVITYLTGCDTGNFPSLIILDFNMPLVNGLEVLVKMGKVGKYANIPKVIYSTSDAPFHVDLCIQAGAGKYFVKPNHKKELLPIAQEMVNIAKKNK